MTKTRLLIVDDHALFRDGLRALLAAQSEIEVAGEAADGESAVAQAAALRPDVILMDIHMPGLNGLDAARRILQSQAAPSKPPAIIMLTMVEEDASVFAAMRAGARGYVLKGARHTDILQAIHAVAGGQVIFGPGLAARLMNYFADLAAGPRPAGPDPLPELSDREREVLSLMAAGHTNKEIAGQLVISGKTVSNHITSIFSKLQVADRTEAIRRAWDAGLGP